MSDASKAHHLISYYFITLCAKSLLHYALMILFHCEPSLDSMDITSRLVVLFLKITFFSFSFFCGVLCLEYRKVVMSGRTYSACWKRAKRLEEKCASDQIATSEFVQTNIPLQCHSLPYQHQEHTGEEASVEQNCADEKSFEDLLSQSSDSSNIETHPPLRHSIARWATEYQVKHKHFDRAWTLRADSKNTAPVKVLNLS